MMVPARREGAAGAQVDDAIDILLSLAAAPGDREPKGGRADRPAPAAPGPPSPRAKPRPLRPVEHPPPARRRRAAGRAGRWTALAGLVAVIAVIPDLGIRPPLALIAPARSSLDTLLRSASTFGQAAIALGGQLMSAVPGRGEAAASAAPGPPPADLVVAAVEPKPERPAWKDPDRPAELPRPAAEAIATPPADPPAHAGPAAAEEEPLQGVPAGVVDHGDPLDPPVDPAIVVEPPATPEDLNLQAAPGDARIEEAQAPAPADGERWMEPLVQALVALPPAEAPQAEPPVEAALDEDGTAPPAPAAFPPAWSSLQPAAAAPDEVVVALTEALAKEREAILDRERERSEALAQEIAGLRSELEDLRARNLELAQAAPAAPAQASPSLEPAQAAPAPSAQADPVPPAETAQIRTAPVEPAPVQAAPPQAAPSQAAPSQAAPPQTPSANAGRLVARAEALIKVRDISGARLLLERAMAEGSAQAAFLLAQTYDPRALAAWGAVGIRPDPGRADQLYARAQAGGVREAGERLSRR